MAKVNVCGMNSRLVHGDRGTKWGADAPSYIVCWPTHPGVLILEFLKSITLGMAVELVPRVSFEN